MRRRNLSCKCITIKLGELIINKEIIIKDILRALLMPQTTELVPGLMSNMMLLTQRSGLIKLIARQEDTCTLSIKWAEEMLQLLNLMLIELMLGLTNNMWTPTRRNGMLRLLNHPDIKWPHLFNKSTEWDILFIRDNIWSIQQVTRNHGLSHISKEIMPGTLSNMTKVTIRHGITRLRIQAVTKFFQDLFIKDHIWSIQLATRSHGSNHTTKETTPGTPNNMTKATIRPGIMRPRIQVDIKFFQDLFIRWGDNIW
jgi:hypothetical protein